MFKYFVLVFIAATICEAVPAIKLDDDAHAYVSKEYKTGDGNLRYEYGYDITNGIGASAIGNAYKTQGEYHYMTPDGSMVKITYMADEFGYHPQSDILPTPPPTPEAIMRALAYIKSKQQKL